jgi:hypothetical protein
LAFNASSWFSLNQQSSTFRASAPVMGLERVLEPGLVRQPAQGDV